MDEAAARHPSKRGNMAVESPGAPLQTTPLHALHRELGARMVPFAGYDMPVQYPNGIIAEHRHTRASAGLFDVSHMGQVRLAGAGAAAALERLVVGDNAELAVGRMRYSLLTDDKGGILDDLMVTRRDSDLFLVVNAGRKTEDLAHLRRELKGVTVDHLADRALLALQGPKAVAALARLAPAAAKLGFMTAAAMTVAGVEAFVSRSGYTGEDGFEISLAAHDAEKLARRLLAEPEVAAVGLGARDSLRLEAGLCLHGHDIDTSTTPVEAGLAWAIGQRRRREGRFKGADVILRQLREGAGRRRVGIVPEGRAPAREGTAVQNARGEAIGAVTSGGFGPSVDGPVAMGYVRAAEAAVGTAVQLMVRGKALPGKVVKMPFVPHRYVKT
jgi:aminomethyltransferase